MAVNGRAPRVPQDPQDVARLLKSLNAGTTKQKESTGFKCRKKAYDVRGIDTSVDSWKFNDWDYKRDDLPTYARGLFTTRAKSGSPEIAARGYDKFFNIDEVNDTRWRNIETFTKGPYELSVKENGCIIFISGLEGDVLLVCSKHSTGDSGDPEKSHSTWGERWIDKQLAVLNKTRADLARELRNLNVTAVAELCDDSFEEHVLAYDESASGLYLHGINCNLPEFATWSSSKVHEFADKWHFKKAQFLVIPDVTEVKAFLEKCAETGSFEGRDTEGFVIRCQKHAGGKTGPLQDWFFKYKFEEPYLMYRQWRETTKAVIAGRQPRFKKHKQITEKYLDFARKHFAKRPGLAKLYQHNHGIIQLRDDFLQHCGLKGSEIIKMEEAEGEDSLKETSSNVILAPLATIGCGKTTVAVALTKLFGWGHIQNDNIPGKGNRPQRFISQIYASMLEHPVVIADRNNHQKRERKQLIDDITAQASNAKFVALHYVHEPKSMMLPEIRRATQERVLRRGDNHQTIQAGSKSEDEIIGIMEGFLVRFQGIEPDAEPDHGFDEIIDLDVTEDSRHNLDLVVNALHKAFPKLVPEVPSADQMDAAIDFALNDYRPSTKHDLSFTSKNARKGNGEQRQLPLSPKVNRSDLISEARRKEPKLEYFSIRLPESELNSALEKTFAAQSPETAYFYRQLKATRRVQPGFHVTLLHMSGAKAHAELWYRLSTLFAEERTSQKTDDPTMATCAVTLDTVVWDSKVMAIVARPLNQSWQSTNKVAHATVGTKSPEIKPFQSNGLLEKWMAEGCTEINGIQELEMVGRPTLLGEVRAVIAHTRS